MTRLEPLVHVTLPSKEFGPRRRDGRESEHL